jgi:hypothetical protein
MAGFADAESPDFIGARTAFSLRPQDISNTYPGAEKFEQIVGEADQLPFGSNVLESTQEKPLAPEPLLDLPEHRLDDCLAHPVQIPPRFAVQFPLHAFS